MFVARFPFPGLGQRPEGAQEPGADRGQGGADQRVPLGEDGRFSVMQADKGHQFLPVMKHGQDKTGSFPVFRKSAGHGDAVSGQVAGQYGAAGAMRYSQKAVGGGRQGNFVRRVAGIE